VTKRSTGVQIGNVAETEKYSLIEITVDSGAAESVLPSDALPQFPLEETIQSKDGEEFVAANGGIIRNEGERKVSVYTLDWKQKDITFQVTGVNKALASVSRICDKGHRVVFDSGQSFIQNKLNGEVLPLRRKNGVWVLEVWVPKKPTQDSGVASGQRPNNAGFHWQG
jgi:hypothetical protein